MSQVAISVVMPVYNAAEFVAECLDSILCQTFDNFELLIADDGSTDNTCDIISSYNDKRIKLFKREHNYIDSCNFLLDEAAGKYIARMDADDVMEPTRLQIQYDYMELNTHIDVLGGGIQCFGETENSYNPFIGEITIHELMDGCCIANPTSFIRAESIKKKKIRYKGKYTYAEDYGFWVDCAIRGLRLRNIEDVLIKYRISKKQVTFVKHAEQINASESVAHKIARAIIRQTNEEVPDYSTSAPYQKLTVIIASYNEGDELINTVRGIRNSTGEAVDIIVIDDSSTDGIDYSVFLSCYNVRYVKNKKRIGAAASKEKGIRLCKSRYFILLDSHMRFYQQDWHHAIVKELRNDDMQILCCQTKVLVSRNGAVEDSDAPNAYGAYIYLGTDSLIPRAKWNISPDRDIIQGGCIPCVLGASYASSVRFWKKIRGYEGLLGFGSEEPYISIKAWLAGGKCKIMEDIIIGHIYKDSNARYNMYGEFIYNLLFVSQMLLPKAIYCRTDLLARKADRNKYSKAVILLEENAENIKHLRSYFLQTFDFKRRDGYLKQNFTTAQGTLPQIKAEDDIIKKILFHVETDTLDIHTCGVYDGMMCAGVLYGLYYKCTGNAVYGRKVREIIYETNVKIENEEISLFFNKGVAGIGWALLYLADLGIVPYNEISDTLDMIDRQVSIVNPNNIIDLSKICDLALYCQSRLGYSKRNGTANLINAQLLRSLKMVCKKYYTNYSIDKLDMKNQIIISMMGLYNDMLWSERFMDIQAVINLPDFLPRDERFWKFGLDGYVGYGINILVTKIKML